MPLQLPRAHHQVRKVEARLHDDVGKPAFFKILGDDALGIEEWDRVPAIREVTEGIEARPHEEFHSSCLGLVDDCVVVGYLLATSF